MWKAVTVAVRIGAPNGKLGAYRGYLWPDGDPVAAEGDEGGDDLGEVVAGNQFFLAPVGIVRVKACEVAPMAEILAAP